MEPRLHKHPTKKQIKLQRQRQATWTDKRRKEHSERLKKAWADKKAREDIQAWDNLGGEVDPWWKKLFRKIFGQGA